MLHCGKVVLCMFTHTVRINAIMSSFFVTDKPATPYIKKLRTSMLMCFPVVSSASPIDSSAT